MAWQTCMHEWPALDTIREEVEDLDRVTDGSWMEEAAASRQSAFKLEDKSKVQQLIDKQHSNWNTSPKFSSQ